MAWGLAWFARNPKAVASLWTGREGTPRLLRRILSPFFDHADDPVGAAGAKPCAPPNRNKCENNFSLSPLLWPGGWPRLRRKHRLGYPLDLEVHLSSVGGGGVSLSRPIHREATALWFLANQANPQATESSVDQDLSSSKPFKFLLKN